MRWIDRAGAIVKALHWRRGLRAGFAVASAMLVCRALGRPMGWAALGGFESVLVDNGGPYRSRMNTIFTVLVGGAVCGLIGSMIPPAGSAGLLLVVAVMVTALVCFGVTFARVASQPVANTAVIILVLYFAGFGSTDRTIGAALGNVTEYVFGGLLAAAISLFLWPVDPFRPARMEIAACYELLAGFTAKLHAEQEHIVHDDDLAHAVGFKRQLRTRLEAARAALGATAARAPARTVRARNLSVLLETADMLFAATVRLTELAESMEEAAGAAILDDVAKWLSGAEHAIADGLRMRPADDGASFAPEGSNRIQYVMRREDQLTKRGVADDSLMKQLNADEREALQNIEIAFEAVRAVWTGVEIHPGAMRRPSVARADEDKPAAWLGAMRENWTLDSIMMRHALRMAAVGAADVLLMRTVHVTHGFWLAMTSIIVLQPYSTGTVRKSLERVGGTIAGGFLAALLAAVIHSYAGVIVVITVCSVLTLATYAVDYGWYSFFLTPTFVLMSLPHLRDWRYAGVRILTTTLGAATAVLAMRLLWPQSMRVELSRLLARSASTASAYVRAVLRYWEAPGPWKRTAERDLLAPARRACGLSSQDAEEALDRAMLDPLPDALHVSGRQSPVNESMLTFTTYIRRFTQCVTTLAAVGQPDAVTVQRMKTLVLRLDRLAAQMIHHGPVPEDGESPVRADVLVEEEPHAYHFDPESSLAEQMLQRMERQAGVLERASEGIGLGS